MPRGYPKKKRAPWGSKTRNGHKLHPVGAAVTDVPAEVPQLETVSLSELLENFHLKDIYSIAEKGAIVTFVKSQV